MPIEITGAHPPEHRLEVGDVVMVRRRLKDKQTKRPFDWTYFAVITRAYGRRAGLYETMILDEKDRQPMLMTLRDLISDEEDRKLRLWYLPEAEWPDGVYAFRTKLILEGRIDLDL